MHQVLMGALSAIAFGIADFMGSQSGQRLGALRALTGMLMVSSIVLTAYVWADGSLGSVSGLGLAVAALHGVLLSCALLFFFHAMTIGPINVVAPIIAAHPVFILAFAVLSGARPEPLQLLAMAGTILGVVVVGAIGHKASSTSGRGATTGRTMGEVIGISVIASLIYAGAIIAAQKAAPLNDDVVTLWLGRICGLAAMLAVFPIRRERFSLPLRWWPFFCLHGVLDSGGLLFLLLGSGGRYDEVTAVVASTFSVITVILAWLILKERMTKTQGVGLALIFICVAVLAFAG